MKRIRICYIGRYAEGGSAVSLKTLACQLDRDRFEPIVLFYDIRTPDVARALEAEGIEVHSLCGRGDRERENGTPETSHPKSVPHSAGGAVRHRVPGFLRRGPCRPAYLAARALRDSLRPESRRVTAALKRFLDAREVDLLHFNNGLRGTWAEVLATRRLKLARLCHVRNFAELSFFERLAARRLDRFIYISKAIEENYEQQGIPPAQGRIVYNGTAVSPALSTQRRTEIRREFGWQPSDFVVANVGRLVEWKGQDTFLNAIRSLVPKRPHLRCLLVGEPDAVPRSQAFAQTLRDQVASWKLGDKVIFTGHRGDANELMAAADVVVHSATTPEPFGRVIIEAMAAGSAVVAAGAGGVLDIVEDGVNGLLAEARNELSFAAAIEKLASSPELRARLAAAGRAHVANHFSVENHVARVQELYLEVLGVPVESTVEA